jgi:hypothetical protein
MLKWLDRKFTEAEESRLEQDKNKDKEYQQRFLKFACEMAKDNEIEDAIYTVWTASSAIIITEEFLYYYGSSSEGNWTRFRRGEAIALNKIVSVETDHDWESISLRFVDGSDRYIKTFNNTRVLDRFFKNKAIL